MFENYMSFKVKLLFGHEGAVRALELRLFAALVLLMLLETSPVRVTSTTEVTMELSRWLVKGLQYQLISSYKRWINSIRPGIFIGYILGAYMAAKALIKTIKAI